MNLRPSGYEPDELPGCSIPQRWARLPKGSRARRTCSRGSARLGRPGGDLLSHVLRRSTIGAAGFNDRVRDGIGWGPRAITTRPAETSCCESFSSSNQAATVRWDGLFAAHELVDQADRTISTGQLHASLRFHIQPINVVVFHGSQGNLVSRAASRLDAFSGYPFRT